MSLLAFSSPLPHSSYSAAFHHRIEQSSRQCRASRVSGVASRPPESACFAASTQHKGNVIPQPFSVHGTQATPAMSLCSQHMDLALPSLEHISTNTEVLDQTYEHASSTSHTASSKCKREVYNALDSPDSSWSSLPVSKKIGKPKAKSWGKLTTAKFRLPITSSTILRPQPEEKRRRIAYLPPAPAKHHSEAHSPSCSTADESSTAWKVTRVTSNQLQNKYKNNFDRSRAPMSRAEMRDKLQHDEGQSRVRSDSRWIAQPARHYPSPPRCDSSPPQKPLSRSPNHTSVQLPLITHNMSKSASTYTPALKPVYTSTRHSLPSPPRSDSPSALHGDICGRTDGPDTGRSFIHVPFDPEMLENRYVRMRRQIAEV